MPCLQYIQARGFVKPSALVQAANGADIHELRRVRAHVLAEQARGGKGRVKARDAQDAAADGLAVQLDVVAHRVVVQGAGVDDEADASALQQAAEVRPCG